MNNRGAFVRLIFAAVVLCGILSRTAECSVDVDSADARYHRGELALSQGHYQTALAEYAGMIAASRALDLDVREYYVGSAYFGMAAAAACMGDTVRTRAFVGEAFATHFWAFGSIVQSPVITAVAGKRFVDSTADFWREERAEEVPRWRPWDPIILKPEARGRSRSAGTIIALHGGNGNIRQFAAHWQNVADSLNMNVIVPPGPIRLSPITFSWEFDMNVVDSAFKALMRRADIRACIGRGPVYLAGFSQGGHATITLSMRNTSIVRGGIVIEGFFESATDFQHVDPVKSRAARIYGMFGDYDGSVFRQTFAQFDSICAQRGIATTMTVVPGMVHELPPDLVSHIRHALEWINAGGLSRAPHHSRHGEEHTTR